MRENAYLKIIINDFKLPFSYMLESMLISAVVIALITILQKSLKKKIQIRENSLLFIFFSYILVVLQTAFFCREPGTREAISLTLFETWGTTVQTHAYVIENVMMFIPFGILLPMLFCKMKQMPYCVQSGFVFSCAIEIAQLYSKRGYFQLDDVVTNTLGTLAGWLIWKCLSKILFYIRKKK